MATPSAHEAAVTAYLAREADTSRTAPLDDEHLAAEIHATLSVAAGTGTAYTTADTLLADAEAKPVGLRRRLLRFAHLHALRADR